MWELHGSPFQRLIIAYINRFYSTDLIVIDRIKAFISGNPEKGKLAEPGLLFASQNRVAIDAVAVAILRIFGAKEHVGKENIFGLAQLRRASELGVAVKFASEIHLTPLDDESREFSEKIKAKLRAEE